MFLAITVGLAGFYVLATGRRSWARPRPGAKRKPLDPDPSVVAQAVTVAAPKSQPAYDTKAIDLFQALGRLPQVDRAQRPWLCVRNYRGMTGCLG